MEFLAYVKTKELQEACPKPRYALPHFSGVNYY